MNSTCSSDTLVVGAGGDKLCTTFNQGSVNVFAISPFPALTFAPASMPYGIQGISYQQQITVSGGAGPYQSKSRRQ